MEIVPGFHRLDEASSNMAHSNVYLVVNQKDLFVVDTGTKGQADKIVDYIEKLGSKPADVSTIILTHYHMDHAGSAKDLQELTGAKVAAGAVDAKVISGQEPYPKPKNLLMRAASFMKPAPVNVDIPLKDCDAIGDLTVILTPGHTEGSIMLIDKNRKVLICGDTLRLDKGKVATGPEHFTWDKAKQTESIKRVAAMDFDALLPGHGEVLATGASKAVRECVGS
jgi:glyoxylase-like metal-dependent hydrolase (beta-lactamase superfamily II)